jgi:penicillin amidase
MSWDLSGNYRSELARLRLGAALGAERTAELMPADPTLGLAPLPDLKPLYAEVAPLATGLLAQSAPYDSALGSNSWVVGGSRTASGKPLLANDPHLGLQTPGLWYFVHVSTPERNLVGGTLPGSPCIVLGRNDHVAWTLTTTNSDTQDLFVERVAPDDPASYLTPTGRERFRVREEVIRVDGEERRIKVRETRHGPVISDVVKPAGDASPKGHVLALAWAALSEENTTVRAGFGINRARSRDEMVAALRDFQSPHQDVVLADREGHVSFVSPARVPVRAAENEVAGRAPVPGWIAKYDWQGFLPFEELPAIHDPAGASIVTANSRVTPPGYRRYLSAEVIPPYRVERIEELLAAEPRHTRESFARMQADARSRLVRELLPLALAAKPEKDAGRETQALLRDWKGDMSADSPAPLVFVAWYRELTRLVYADELGELFNDSWDMRAPFMISVLKGGLERWCDDVRTPGKEDCGMMTARAFDFAAADLEKRYGARAKWRWGAAHVAAADHRPFGFVPVISRLFNVAPETAGDAYSVNVGHFFIRDASRPFANRHAPSMRAVYDLADLDRSLFMHSTGQSGNFLSPWYGSFGERWAKVQFIEIPTRRESIAGAHTLRLLPQ